MEATLPGMVEHWAKDLPDGEAIGTVDGDSLTYRRLANVIAEQSRDLRAWGLARDDRVGIALPNGAHAATAFLTVATTATAAPLNPRFRMSEFAYYLDDLDAAAVIVLDDDPTECSAAASKLDIPIIRMKGSSTGGGPSSMTVPASPSTTRPAPAPDDIALVLHTSGTTARPKIVPLTHANLTRSAHNVATTLRLTTGDRCLNVMPLFHIHGLVAALLATLRSGASVVCTPGFDAGRFFPWMRDVGPTWYTAVPTMHQAIVRRVEAGHDRVPGNARLRFVRSSSASLAPTVIESIESIFGVPTVEAYGMTEAAHQMTSNPLPPLPRKPGSVGPAAGPEVEIANESGGLLPRGATGEVVIRGPNVTPGYVGGDATKAAFHPGGWFRTGDQGYLDDDGYLLLTGRLKEMINRAGESIAPREIDEVLLAHPSVSQAVAFAIPDPDLGEEVAAACIVDDEVDEQTLRSFAAQRLSLAKVPKRIVIVDEIPKGPTGKLQRIGLADKLGVTSARPAAAGSADASDDQPDGAIVAVVEDRWKSILNIGAVGENDEFLEVGGDSVRATELVVALEEHFDIEIPLMEFYDAATIERQSALIARLIA